LTDDNSKLVDIDDLDAFEQEFYNRKPVATDDKEEKSEVEDEEEVEENVDDADATEENNEPEEEEEAEEPKPAPKKKSSFQDRINELTAKAREAERREAELRREIEQLKVREPEANTKPEAKPSKAEDPAPQPDAVDENGDPLYPLGEFDPKFIRDLTKFTITQETKAAKEVEAEAAKQRQLEAEQEALQNSWGEKVSAAEEELPDIREKLSDLTDTFANIDPNYGEFLAATIMSCDYGPQIMYYLSQNIGEAQKIVASGPAAATLAIGRLDAKFVKAPQEEKRNTKKVSGAPTPPERANRGSAGRFSVAADTDDLDAFERAFFNKK
jgi:DNA repair exonuclease SbcCD ATPase subunit